MSKHSHPSHHHKLLFTFLLLTTTVSVISTGGQWHLLQQNIGIVAMHMQLLHNDHVIIYDRTDFGPSNLSLPTAPQHCRLDPNDRALVNDCTAHSIDYNPITNTFRPLTVQTDVWCSSGAITPDGRLIQTGGFNDGEKVVRIFNPNNPTPSDWEELGNQLLTRRWYSTNHILPDGQLIIIGGRRSFNYEFYPKSTSSNNLYSLRFLVQTNEHNIENNLYPFVFLNIDGNLFIFANDRAILFDYTKNTVIKTYPPITGSAPRNYPSTGSAVLLPLHLTSSGTTTEAEVIVCGGAPRGSFQYASNKHSPKFIPALNTCGRIKITDINPVWEMETMPMPRVMGDMLILPNGKILIINGAGLGTAGWEYGRNAVLQPLIYDPISPVTTTRFTVQTGSTIPRVYHSTALLLRDGRVLVGGSNPHVGYNFTGPHLIYPTELRLEAYSPPYLDPTNLRPVIVAPTAQTVVGYGKVVEVRFKMNGVVDLAAVSVTMFAPPFNTHSFSMNQRLLVLSVVEKGMVKGNDVYGLSVKMPSEVNLAPSGYYLLFVVYKDVPSEGVWVKIQ